MIFPADKVLCILYSSGGTADVGRHAICAALDEFKGKLRVLTRDPETLKEKNWNCACGDHTFTPEELKRMDIRKVDVTKDDLSQHLDKVGGVISALGNRQPFYGDRVGRVGSTNLVSAMEKEGIERLVSVTSVGCNEDWPPMEFHWAGGILKWLFRTGSRTGYKDLNGAENAIFKSTLNYLVVRPVGLGEERRPKGEWVIQNQKYKDKVGCDMSKLDCARFCVKEVLNPTYKRQAVVIGSDWNSFQLNEPKV